MMFRVREPRSRLMSGSSPASSAESGFDFSLIWNVLQTVLAVGLSLGVPAAWFWGIALSHRMQDAWYVPGFLMMAQGALLLVIAPTALLHAQRLRAAGARPPGLVRSLYVTNIITTTCTFGYLTWGAFSVVF